MADTSSPQSIHPATMATGDGTATPRANSSQEGSVPPINAAAQRQKNREIPRASRKAKKALLNEAAAIHRLASRGLAPNSPEVKEQARNLLAAVITWQASARRNSEIQGFPPRPRPPFTNPPPTPRPGHQPTLTNYCNQIFFWASNYAWNKQDGLDTSKQARHLVQTAYVGHLSQEKRAPTPTKSAENATDAGDGKAAEQSGQGTAAETAATAPGQ